MKILTYILSVLLVLSIALNIHYYNKPPTLIEKEVEVIKRDTVIEYDIKIDTVYNTKLYTQYKYKIINDTVFIENKPELYKDSTDIYDIAIQSVKLDWYKLNIHHTDTVTYEKEIIKNIYTNKKQHFNHGISLGFGYGIWNKRPDLFIGYSVQYSF